jgi:tetratricopeptide (TPR) repeat protein
VATRRSVPFRAGVCAGVLVLASLAGCRDDEKAAGKSKAGDSATPTLAQQINALPPGEQIEFVRALKKQKPDDATVAFHCGNAYYYFGSLLPAEENANANAYYDSAITEYTRAIAIDSTYSKAYVNMGLAYDAAGKRNDARGAFRKAIEINPNDVLAHCHLGLLEASYDNYDEAMRLYQRALELDPNSAQAHYNLGLAFAEKKVFAEALVEWEKVIALDPEGELGKTAAENVRAIKRYMEPK